MSLNKVMLIGNVGADPEVRYLESNPQNPAAAVKVATIRLATTERYRDRNGEPRENTEWHSVVVWRNNADVAEKFVHKGSQIYIEGKLRTRQWTDQTGAKRYTTEVVADVLQLLGKRPDGEAAPAGAPAVQPGYQGGYAAAPAPAAPVAPATASGPVGPAPAAPSAPAPAAPAPVSPDYNGPVPAAEPSDDLPF